MALIAAFRREQYVALVTAFRREQEKEAKLKATEEVRSFKPRLMFHEKQIKILEQVASEKLSIEAHLFAREAKP